MFSTQSRQTSQLTSRSCRQELFYKIGVLENFSTGKHLCRSLFLKKDVGPCNSIKKYILPQVFSYEF